MEPEVSVEMEQATSKGGTASHGSAEPASVQARVFEWPIRVYWEDTDAGGVVYHSIYLNYFERCRSEYLRAAGVFQRELRERDGIQFVVVDMNIRWARAAQYDDQLVVTAHYVETRGATCTFRQTIYRGAVGGEVVATAECRAATIDARTLRPVRMPKALLAAMESYSAEMQTPVSPASPSGTTSGAAA
jgi:acyl-CoA thioester hydrolase